MGASLADRLFLFLCRLTRGRENQQAQPLVRKTTSEYAKPMRKLCENYEKTIARKPSAHRLAVWLAVSLAPRLLESTSQSYPESRASLVRAQRAHSPSCLGFFWFWGVPRQSAAFAHTHARIARPREQGTEAPLPPEWATTGSVGLGVTLLATEASQQGV